MKCYCLKYWKLTSRLAWLQPIEAFIRRKVDLINAICEDVCSLVHNIDLIVKVLDVVIHYTSPIIEAFYSFIHAVNTIHR